MIKLKTLIFAASLLGAAGATQLAEGKPKRAKRAKAGGPQKLIFLHHSTGQKVWEAGVKRAYQALRPADVLKQQLYPLDPYPWDNRPQDYYKLWVKEPGKKGQATLDQLTKKYDLISFKHCYTADWMRPGGRGKPDGEVQSLANYKAAYKALKKKLHQYPDTKFVVWTVAASTRPQNKRAKHVKSQNLAFYKWVKNVWDEPGDNIYVFDFRKLETRGKLDFMSNADAAAPKDSHPGDRIAAYVAPYFANRLRHIVEGQGDSTPLTGK